MKTIGYAAHSTTSALAPYHFERRDLRPDDVAIEILYCGVCHTDLHSIRNDWGGTKEGELLSAGAYYYVLRINGFSLKQSLLIRYE